MRPPTGYDHPGYAASMAEFGRPARLKGAGGWVLERSIPGSTARDAMGCYPLFSVLRWEQLADDLERLEGGLVSFTAVCDPFRSPPREVLERTFGFVRPFKHHVVVDLKRLTPSRHHRQCVRAALRQVNVEEIAHPISFLDEWCRVYQVLVDRHRIQGVRAPSRDTFRIQLGLPGVRLFRAVAGSRTVGSCWWFVSDGIAYLHLQASTERGYALGASYALTAVAFDRLRTCADIADLGGAAGDGSSQGLFRYKQGWSPNTVMAHLCGRVLNQDLYRQLSANRTTAYFPAYRDGEMLAGPQPAA